MNMKKLFFCALSIPFIGLSQNNVTTNSTQEISELNTNSLVHYTFSDTGINSELSEVGATFFKNKFIIVSNKKRRHAQTTLNESSKKYNNNTYCTDVDKHGNLSFPLHFSKILDNEFNEGGMTFSEDEKTIYFTKNNGDNKPFKLFKASFDQEAKGYWKDITEIKVTSEEYSVETPFLNKTNNKIYFSSNMPGGFGGYDIYEADVAENGTITNIKNLGNKINSKKDEKYIFITPSNKYIYFSSNGHKGNGGYDIFRSSILNNNSFENTVNIGSGLNTDKDETAFMLTSDTQGYISINKRSNREDFDIYRFDINKKEQELNITIVDLDSNTKLTNTNVVITDEFGNVVKETVTDNEGKIVLKSIPLTKYTITTNKEGYDSNLTDIVASPNSPTISKTINLIAKKPIVEKTEVVFTLNNIYFDFNKASIKEESKSSLMTIVKQLNDHPNTKISIIAHTDNKGSEKYNQVLSEKRAKSAYDFLIKEGIDQTRLSHSGKGESQPLHDCKTCTKQQDLENRRIEFKINE